MSFQITRATLAGIELLQRISRETFKAAFAHQNTAENMRLYLSENLGREKLLAELQTEGSEFYLAYDAEELIGYLKLNFAEAQTDLQGPKSMEIERIYVLPDYYGRQAGSQLLNFALQRAREQHAEFVWLGVWEHNRRAIKFYQKNNFREFAKHSFMLGSDKQTDILMRVDLQ